MPERQQSLGSGYLFMGLIDEDFIIPSLSYALIWLKPYYWTVGSGTDAYNKPFSAAVIHKDNSDQKGAISQTIDDFKEFWKIDKSKNNVYELTNMGIVGIRPEGGTDGMFPIYRRVPVHLIPISTVRCFGRLKSKNSTIKTERLPSAFSTNIKICRPKNNRTQIRFTAKNASMLWKSVKTKR